MTTIQEHFLDSLHGKDRFKVILWSTFCRKRYYAFDTYWNRGMHSRAAYKTADALTFKEVREFYKENYKPYK